jgi:hypothetical protein
LDVRTSRQLVRVAFALAAMVVLVVTAFALEQIRGLEDSARDIVQNMLSSVRLVGELSSEEKTKQILVNEHILASETIDRARLETQIAAVETQIAATMRAYAPWVALPGEQAAWDQARQDLKDLDGPIARVVAFSRENLDTEARWEMELAAGLFTPREPGLRSTHRHQRCGRHPQPLRGVSDPLPADDHPSRRRTAGHDRDRGGGALDRGSGRPA